MAIYNTGSVQVKAGSAIVVGTDTSFNNYVSVNYIFKLADAATCYTIAGVNSATRLTLSSRYTNTSYQTARNQDNLASGTTATQIYSGSLSNTPVIQSEVTITASLEKFTDDGGGILTGNASPAGSGTIGYDDGAYSVTLGTALTATINISASYTSGDTRNSEPYQIIRDYTTNYDLPEMGANDINFAHIYTKGVRLIDSAMYSASVDTIKVISRIKMGSHQYLMFGDMDNAASVAAVATAVDASNVGSMYISTAGQAWITTSDTVATQL